MQYDFCIQTISKQKILKYREKIKKCDLYIS